MRMGWPSLERHAQQLPLTRGGHATGSSPTICATPATRPIGALRRCWRRASPDLPPALVVTAGFDPLVRRGRGLRRGAAQGRRAGRRTSASRARSMAFVTMGRIVADAGRAVTLACRGAAASAFPACVSGCASFSAIASCRARVSSQASSLRSQRLPQLRPCCQSRPPQSRSNSGHVPLFAVASRVLSC